MDSSKRLHKDQIPPKTLIVAQWDQTGVLVHTSRTSFYKTHVKKYIGSIELKVGKYGRCSQYGCYYALIKLQSPFLVSPCNSQG